MGRHRRTRARRACSPSPRPETNRRPCATIPPSPPMASVSGPPTATACTRGARGANKTDLRAVSAPGGAGLTRRDDDIWSTVPRGTGAARGCGRADFDTYAGTSMATPHVVGVAALLYAQGRSVEAVEDAILSTAVTPGTGARGTHADLRLRRGGRPGCRHEATDLSPAGSSSRGRPRSSPTPQQSGTPVAVTGSVLVPASAVPMFAVSRACRARPRAGCRDRRPRCQARDGGRP